MSTSRQRCRVILVNGGSSSGKSSTCSALQEVLDEPFYLFDSDAFRYCLHDRYMVRVRTSELKKGLHLSFISGFHRATAAFAMAGNNIILDHMLFPLQYAKDFDLAFEGLNVFRVLLLCRPQVAAERERLRGDRPEGLARQTAVSPQKASRYDIAIDTETLRPDAIAKKISAALGLH